MTIIEIKYENKRQLKEIKEFVNTLYYLDIVFNIDNVLIFID